MSNNIKTNQVDDVVDNELKFDSSNSLATNNVQNNLPMVNLRLRVGKKYIQTLNSGLTLLWDIGSTYIIIKIKHINPYNSKLRAKKVKYINSSGPYKTTHDVKVPFSMTEFSNKRIITHRFHIDNAQGDTGIGYAMIIGCDLMVKLGPKANFGRQIMEWGKTALTMK